MHETVLCELGTPRGRLHEKPTVLQRRKSRHRRKKSKCPHPELDPPAGQRAEGHHAWIEKLLPLLRRCLPRTLLALAHSQTGSPHKLTCRRRELDHRAPRRSCSSHSTEETRRYRRRTRRLRC